jgi:hypothetical protein
MENKMPEMYFPPNLYKVEPLPKHSIKFLHHELDCRSLQNKWPSTPIQSRLQKSDHSLPQQAENLREINNTVTLFTQKIMPQPHELLQLLGMVTYFRSIYV